MIILSFADGVHRLIFRDEILTDCFRSKYFATLYGISVSVIWQITARCGHESRPIQKKACIKICGLSGNSSPEAKTSSIEITKKPQKLYLVPFFSLIQFQPSIDCPSISRPTTNPSLISLAAYERTQESFQLPFAKCLVAHKNRADVAYFEKITKWLDIYTRPTPKERIATIMALRSNRVMRHLLGNWFDQHSWGTHGVDVIDISRGMHIEGTVRSL